MLRIQDQTDVTNEAKESSKKKNLNERTKDFLPDDPMRRHEGLKLDIKCEEEERKIAELRRKALEQAQKMSTTEEN